MTADIGQMDVVYLVGRYEILSWINSTLQLNLSKVEVHIEVNKLIKRRSLDNLDYNPLERRGTFKGGKEAVKKCPPLQCSTKGSTNPSKTLSSHMRRGMMCPQLTLEINIPKIKNLMVPIFFLMLNHPIVVVGAIKRILYDTDDDASVVIKAKAMVSLKQKEAEVSSFATNKVSCHILMILLKFKYFV
ncbi:hypothetical protein K2173_024527 [Erythroxylum novogranatense]|uniref:Uncharacterized protein n=1 Tax=Erythroxylum novogranatense TaxID=1862640 RepID=A0AAV8SUK7_9ROSI|nr:hypothetical protein K2173_024527 [Erythroxylum novogranatense]